MSDTARLAILPIRRNCARLSFPNSPTLLALLATTPGQQTNTFHQSTPNHPFRWNIQAHRDASQDPLRCLRLPHPASVSVFFKLLTSLNSL